MKTYKCIVHGCKDPVEGELSHCLPKKEEILQRWLCKVNRQDLIALSYNQRKKFRVCGNHFSASSYKYEGSKQLHFCAEPQLIAIETTTSNVVSEEIPIIFKDLDTAPNLCNDAILKSTTRTYTGRCAAKHPLQGGLIIKTEKEIIVPNMHQTRQEVLGNYEFVQVKQEVKIEPEEYFEKVKQEEVMEEVKQEEELIIKNEYDETCDDPVNENYKEQVNQGQDEKSDNIRPNSQIEEESLKKEGGSPPAKRLDQNPSKIKHKPAYYECKKCFEKFPDFKGLKKHREEIKYPRNNYNISCPVCNKIFKKRVMKRHMRTHTGEKPYCCEICWASFSEAGSLGRHKRAQHSNINACRNFQCNQCERAFTTEVCLQQHSAIQGEKKFSCSVCGRGFVSKILLDSHSKIHTGARPYICDVCGKAYSLLGSLKTHKLIHADEKTNVCSVCCKVFTQPVSLKCHMRIYTGEKPYICKVCSKAFTQNITLHRHMRLHSREKPYSCAVCNCTFTRADSVRKHMKIHTREKPYSCGICDKSFVTNGKLTMHKHCKKINEVTAIKI